MRGTVVVMCLLLVACDEQGRALSDWTIEADDRTHAVELPSTLTDVVGDKETSFTMRRSVALADSERGQPLTLVVSCFHGPLTARANGTRAPDVGDRAVGEHRFLIPAELTEHALDIELAGSRDWTAYVGKGLGASPVLRVGWHGQRGPSARVNRGIGIASVAVLVLMASVFATTYLLDRRRRENAAAAICALGALPMVLGWHLGAMASWGLWASLICGVSVGVVGLAGLAFIHRIFELGRVPRLWRLAMSALIAINFACVISLPVTAFVDRATAPFVLIMNGYYLVLLVRAVKRGVYRTDAWILLVTSVVVIVLVSLEFSAPTETRQRMLGGVHLFSVAVLFIVLGNALVLGRQHVRRRRDVERTADELNRQLRERSRELAESLRRLGGAAHPLAPDRVVASRYRVVRQLGAGGMGTVYEVEHLEDRKRYALKTLRSRADAHALARFAREAQIAAALHDPHLLPVVDLGVDGGMMFLVMPLLATSLQRDRERFHQVPAARRVLAQIARGLAVLHAHDIVHRDLKPANVLLDSDGARIADFGLAFAATSYELTRVGARFGTPRYMAPELSDARAASPASDIFAFGIVAWDLVGDGSSTASREAMMSTLKGRLGPTIARCLESDPNNRPTAATLVEALEH